MRIFASICSRFLSAALVGAVLPGCEADATARIEQPWSAEREQRGDTVVIRTIGGSVWGDTMVLVPELAVGGLDGEEAYLFGNVRGLDLDAEGRIVVVDGQARNVRVFSPHGEHLQTIGREGGGPGEFRHPDHVRVSADGRMIVRDPAVRFSVFSAKGAYLGGWPLLSGFATSTPFFLDAEGRVLDPTVRGHLLRYSLDGTVLDTVDLPTRGCYTAPRLEVTMADGMATYSIPFMPRERWTVTRDGRFLFGVTDRYRLERWEPDGGVLRIEREVDPVPVSPGEAAQAREEIVRRIRRANDPDWRWQGPDIPSSKPPWRFMLAGLDHTLWVFRSTVAVEEANPAWDPQRPEAGFTTRWVSPGVADVFDVDGRYLGPVKMPEGVRLFPAPLLTAERVWAVSIHQLGYPQVVRFRVEPLGDEPRAGEL